MDNNLEGIYRRMDDLGRVVIPKSLRRELGMTKEDDENAPVFEIFLMENGVYLKRRKDLDSSLDV